MSGAEPVIRPTCGSSTGAGAHYRAGERACEQCRAWKREDMRRRRQERRRKEQRSEIGDAPYRWYEAPDRASEIIGKLLAEGWNIAAISRHVPWSETTIDRAWRRRHRCDPRLREALERLQQQHVEHQERWRRADVAPARLVLLQDEGATYRWLGQQLGCSHTTLARLLDDGANRPEWVRRDVADRIEQLTLRVQRGDVHPPGLRQRHGRRCAGWDCERTVKRGDLCKRCRREQAAAA